MIPAWMMSCLRSIPEICSEETRVSARSRAESKENVKETKAKIASLEYIQNELKGIANLV